MAVTGIVQNARTVAGTRSTSGDGTAVITASGVSNVAVHILDGAIKTTTPGDVVTVTIKDGSATLYKVACTADVFGVATLPYMVTAANATAVYVNLSADVSVEYTLTYVIASA